MAVFAISASGCFTFCQHVSNSLGNQCLKLFISHRGGGGGCCGWGGSGSGCFPWRHFLQNQKSNKISLVPQFVLQG
ncbi:hypothetical protein Tco_0479225 [Tanacetum coccineum]